MNNESNHTQLLRKILHKEANGKTIWQPRIDCWYWDRVFRGEELQGRFKGASELELYNLLGVSNRLYMFNSCIEKTYDDPSVVEEIREIDDMKTEHTIKTPVGTVSSILSKNTSNYGQMPIKWWVEEPEDFEAFMFIEEHTNYRFNQETYDKLLAEWGHLGLPGTFLPRVNMQRLMLDLCGVENTYYLMSDCPDVFDAYIETLNRSQMRMIEMMCDTPFEWINYGDNIHSKLISPTLFEKYIIPAYQQRNETLQKAGKFTYAHFDGDVKELLPYFHECHFNGIEAITPLPQGDVTLKEARDAMEGLVLIDGVSAILFDERYPLEMLKQQTEECLELFEGQLVLGISDEISSTGTLDRVEYVTEIVENFNAKR